MIPTKRKVVFGISVVMCVLAAWFVVRPSIQSAAAPKNFVLGMTFEDAKRRLTPPFRVRERHRTFPPAGPTDRDKEVSVFRELLSERDHVCLGFSYNGRLVVIRHLGGSSDLFRVNRPPEQLSLAPIARHASEQNSQN
jgi:hypothetical protein